MLAEKDLILIGWVQDESERVGRDLIEGLDYDVFYEGSALYIAYYTDPDHDGIQIFEITDDDLPTLH